MSWYRGTEAPMDTSPAGPPQRTIFDAEDGPSWGSAPSSSTQNHSMNAYRASATPQDILTDVEMTSLTPPSQRFYDQHANDRPDESKGSVTHLDEALEKKASDRPISSGVISRARRRRSVLTRKGKRLAHLQSREIYHGRHDADSDDDADMTDDNDTVPYDNDEEVSDTDYTPSRLRSITKYAVSYILPGVTNPPTAVSYANPLDRPELLLGYAQLIFNASILAAFLYMLYHVVKTVQRDVAEKVRAYEMDTLSEITACASAYTANRCGTELQAPALLSACKNWERCSARDPAVVGTARVTAETFAEILNGFVDSVSWKTMLFTLLSLSIVVGATNSTLSFFRIRTRSSKDSAPAASQNSSVNPAYHVQQQPHHLLASASGGQSLHLPYAQHFAGQAYPSWQTTTPPAKYRIRSKSDRQ